MRIETMTMARLFCLLLVCCALGAAPLQAETGEAADVERIAEHYATLAHAMYSDAVLGAEELQRAVSSLIAEPSEERLSEARKAWTDARRVYSQTEVFRFGNPNVDQWEGRVNAWPVDEGFIDYVAGDYQHDLGNPYARLNLVASDVRIDTDSMRLRHEHGGLEANVATGFHAIEFLLWGQDLNERPELAGQRPFTDYSPGSRCTNGSCERRGRYLTEVAGLLTADLRAMARDWEAQVGEYRRYFDGLPSAEKLRRILVGLGGMAGGELAGERLRVALLTSAQEEEQSCFSDTTHLDVYDNLLGIENVYHGRYTRRDGMRMHGAAPAEWVEREMPAVHADLAALFAAAEHEAEAIVARSAAGEPFDQQILPDHAAARRGIGELIDTLEKIAASYDIALARLAER